MPRTPNSYTIADFLIRKPPDPSPPKKRKGKKRKLSLSPLAAKSPSVGDALPPSPTASVSAKLSASPGPRPPNKSPPLTLLPYQLRSKKARSSLKPVDLNLSYSPKSRMDSHLLDADRDDEPTFNPTPEEADALLRDDPVQSNSSGPDAVIQDSPTSAVKAAIEAQIAEGMNTELMQFDITTNNAKTNAKTNANTNPTGPALPPLFFVKKPLPLFPNGLPFSLGSDSGKRDGSAPPSAPPPVPTQPANQNNKIAQTTYASKAKSPPKAREQVDHILYVYNSWTVKRPLAQSDWSMIDDYLIEALDDFDPNLPYLVRIANSGFDAAHRCGFVACRDEESAAWCKKTILGMGDGGKDSRRLFRAWSKGEQPEIRLCRLFFPSRFDRVDDSHLLPLLCKHNPSLQAESLKLKGIDIVQGGRAVFIEFDPVAYSYVRAHKHRLEFLMMDIDCQLFIPKKATIEARVEGITKLKPKNAAPSVAPVTNVQTSSSSSRGTELLPPTNSLVIQPVDSRDPRLNKVAPPPPAEVGKKRERSGYTTENFDGAKKATTPRKSNTNSNRQK